MKIVQITPAYKPAYIYGGPTMSVAKLCEALASIKADVEVFTTTANGLNELDVEPGKTVSIDGVYVTYFKRLTKDHTHFSPTLLWALRRTLNEKPKTKNALIIHIHSWWNLVTIFSCLVAKIYQIPVLLSPRGMLTHYTQNNRNSFFKSALHHVIGKSLLKYCHILASSEQEKQNVLQIIKPKSIHVLPNLVSLTTQNNSEKGETKGEKLFRLLFLSRIEEKKGLELLFEALALLTIDWRLSIAGSGQTSYIENLKQKAAQLNLNDRINWLGQINNEAKFEFIAQHDLLVLTSYNENFANVVIESLSVGTPVLLSEQVGLSTYVLANDLGFVTDLSPNKIREAINEAFYDTIKRNKIRTEAPQIIKNDFDEQKLIQKYLDLYQFILNQN
ncbi:MAG: glycosyltransferase [Bacteroidota bacterium]